jgi:hypothetical protein
LWPSTAVGGRAAAAVLADKKAWASMARTVQRRQEVQLRTLLVERSEFLAGEGFLDLPADPGDADQLGDRDRPGA